MLFGCVFTCNTSNALGEPMFDAIATCAVHVCAFMKRSHWARPLETFGLGFRLCIGASPSCIHQHNLSISCVWLACVTNCGEAYSQIVVHFATSNYRSQPHGPSIQCNGISTRRAGLTYCPACTQSSETASWAMSKWIDEKTRTSNLSLTGLENATQRPCRGKPWMCYGCYESRGEIYSPMMIL